MIGIPRDVTPLMMLLGEWPPRERLVRGSRTALVSKEQRRQRDRRRRRNRQARKSRRRNR